MKNRLSGAHNGYNHQDAVVAYALATLLVPETGNTSIVVETKVFPQDKFDDLQIIGKGRTRVQIKSHVAPTRPLRLADLTTAAIEFCIDDAVRSFSEDANPADEYRLFTTYDSPEDKIADFLRADRTSASLLPGLRTSRYRLIESKVWPEGLPPAWKPLELLDRNTFIAFCRRFIIETGCPVASGDLRSPAMLEQEVFTLLKDKIGIGAWPNHDRRLIDTAALLMRSAFNARTRSLNCDEQYVISELALRVDYGRVHEQFPVAEDRMVPRNDALNEIRDLLDNQPRVAVVGAPGIGKSWLLHQVAQQLKEEGWVVAMHYCFVDLMDNEREIRATIETLFGSLMAELLDGLPHLTQYGAPRFAAGAFELEQLVANAKQTAPNQSIALIVDGIDHVDRLTSRRPGGSARIVEELSNLRLPAGVTITLGSQPGTHLSEFQRDGHLYLMPSWPEPLVRMLLQRMKLASTLKELGLAADLVKVEDSIVIKSVGSPLYATYLTKTAILLAQGEPSQLGAPPIIDIASYLQAIPGPDSDLRRYYEWLLEGLQNGTGTLWIAELLSLLDFRVSSQEIREINPAMGHYVQRALAQLAPVLSEDLTRGGLRIYHESFQRHVRSLLSANSEASIPDIIKPVVEWLSKRGFFQDTRAFRSLPQLHILANQPRQCVSLIETDFVARAASHAQPADAVMTVLATAADAAAGLQAWPDLARLVELARAATVLYHERLIEENLAEQFGRAYAKLYGTAALAERLLYDGRCTFPAEAGLVLCQLCDEQGSVAPWSEYFALLGQEHKSKKRSGHDDRLESVVPVAQLTGRFRLSGRLGAPPVSLDYLASGCPPHAFDNLKTLGDMYGIQAIEEVVDALPPEAGECRGWAALAVAYLAQRSEEPAVDMKANYLDLPSDSWRFAIRLGANPQLFPRNDAELHAQTTALLDPATLDIKKPTGSWLTQITLAGAVGDETTLLRTELQIAPDFWFRKWLRFCLVLARPAAEPSLLLGALRALSEDDEPFKGKPRMSDLYSIHNEIRYSLRQALRRLDDNQWAECLELLGQLSKNTVLWLKGTRSGPVAPDALIDLCIETADTPNKRIFGATFCRKFLSSEHRSGEIYDTHAADNLRLAQILASVEQRAEALTAWEEACHYLAGYGWRKDITFYEILDPLTALATADVHRARQCLQLAQPVIEGIRVHTDGKETYYGIHAWLEKAAHFHPAGVLAYLAHEKAPLIAAVGGLDRAWPLALQSLAKTESNDSLLSAIAWMASGRYTREQPALALQACENIERPNVLIGPLWQAIVAALDGEGSEPVPELNELLAASALKLSFVAPVVTHVPAKAASEASTSGRPGFTLPCTDALELPEEASPAQIAYGVRHWQQQRHKAKASIETVTNAIGWRLLCLQQTAGEQTALALIEQIAHDLQRWTGTTLLVGLAEGLERTGCTKMAALAYTLAYTRATDGWRHFGKTEDNYLFLRALALNPSIVWDTLAAEVADGVAQGGYYGTTTHLIELLVAGNKYNDAFDAWSNACQVITWRLPPTGPADEIDTEYQAAWEGNDSWLASLIISRLNHSLLHDKRLAVASVALLACYRPKALAAALGFVVAHDLPATSLITVLHALYCCEPQPYQASDLSRDMLRTIAQGELVSARVLARQLLIRLGEDVRYPPASAPPSGPVISAEQMDFIRRGVGIARIHRLEEIWPHYGRAVAGLIDTSISSELLRRRTSNFVDSTEYRHRRSCSYDRLWSPILEEVERVLQTTGTAVRSVLAQDGIIDPKNETRLGLALLGNTELSIRWSLSRVVRPSYIPSANFYKLGTTSDQLLTCPAGEFEGWIVLGWREEVSLFGEAFNNPVVGQRQVYAGIEFTSHIRGEDGNVPFGKADAEIWTAFNLDRSIRVFRGAFVGIDFFRDNYGVVELLCPPQNALTICELNPAGFEQGLTLMDPSGVAAIVGRRWRQKLLDATKAADSEPELEGSFLLARADIFHKISAYAIEPPVLVITVSETEYERDEV